MIINPERIILVGQSIQRVRQHLQELGIAPLPFERRQCIIITPDPHGTERTRGLEAPWAVMPGLRLEPKVASFIHANTRYPEQDFHELLARALAWKIWHDH